MQILSYTDRRGLVYKMGAPWPGTKKAVKVISIEPSPDPEMVPDNMPVPAHDMTVVGQKEDGSILIAQIWDSGATLILEATAQEFQQMQAMQQQLIAAAQAEQGEDEPEEPSTPDANAPTQPPAQESAV